MTFSPTRYCAATFDIEFVQEGTRCSALAKPYTQDNNRHLT
jgi:hypothetical protein